MRQYFNLFLTLLAILCSGYLTWRYTQPELNGHWHIIQDDSPINPGIATLDIGWNNMVQADKCKVVGFGIGGPLDRFRRHIFLFPTCLSLELNLSWKGDTLILTEANSYREDEIGVLKAVRIAKGKCTAEEDHFLPSKYQISLPLAALNETTVPYQTHSLGLVLTPEKESLPQKIVNHYGRILSLDELVEEAEMVDIKNPRSAPATAVSIFANKDVSGGRIEEIVELFAQEGKGRKVYLVKKEVNINGALQFLWVDI